MRKFLVSLAAVLPCLTSIGAAADWPSWRGPHGTGVAEGTGYPVEWSDEQGIVWKHDISGIGASTPVVSGDSIFFTSTADDQNQVFCVGLDGKQRWTQTLGKAIPGKTGKDGTGANPSAVTDGQFVFVYFKSGDLGCFSVDGKLQWQTNVFQRFAEVNDETLWWDLGNSPVLIDGAVVITMMHTGPSYLAAFERSTGKVLWKQDRMTDAPREAAQSYTTPVVTNNPDGQQVIIVTGADYVTCHSAQNGTELWRVGSLNPDGNEYFRSISSSVEKDGIVVVPYARGGTLTAIRMGGSGDVTDSHVLWTRQGTSADVPTPAIHNGRVYVVRDVQQDRGTVDCLDLKTGETIWTGQLERHRATFRSSPVVADGKIYVTRQDGTVFVLDADGDQFQVLAKNDIGDQHTVASPVFVDGRILLRTQDHLYLIGQKLGQ